MSVLAALGPVWQSLRSWPRPLVGLLSAHWKHAARTVAAALSALWIAYALELDMPFSAAVTVMLVAHPVHGMVLSKSINRFLGTLAGALVSVVLMGAFAQTPEMFMLGLSLWMGACTFASTLLRNFRSYGTVLAGYTVVLIAMPGVEAPDTMFHLVANRVSDVTIGIVCSGLVAALFTSRSAERGLRHKLRGGMLDLVDYAGRALRDPQEDGRSAEAIRRRLAAEIVALDSLAEFAAAESAAIAPLRDTLRIGLAAMLGVLAAGASAEEALRRLPRTEGGHLADPGLARAVTDCLGLLGELAIALGHPDSPARAGELAALRQRLLALAQRIEAGIDPTRLPDLVARDRLAELLDELRATLGGPIALAAPPAGPGRTRPLPGAEEDRRRAGRLGFHLDWRGAAINGVRATLATWVAGAVWILTAWPYGWMMVAMVVPNAGLLAMRDHPERDAVELTKGCLLATLLGWVSLAYLLPLFDSFAGLCLVIGPILFLAVLLSVNPATAFIGVGVSVFYLTLLTPSNPMVYNASLFLNSALPTVGGAALTMVVFRVVLPNDLRGHVRAIVRAMRRDILDLLNRDVAPSDWETRMHDRMIRLIGRMRAAEMNHAELIRGGFAALRIGREVIRARRLHAGFPPGGLVDRLIEPSRHALARIDRAPRATVRALRLSANGLLTVAAHEQPERAAELGAIAASLLEVAMLVGRNRRFFQSGGRGLARGLPC